MFNRDFWLNTVLQRWLNLEDSIKFLYVQIQIHKKIFRIGDFRWLRTKRLSDNRDDHNKDKHNNDFDEDIYKKDYHY